MYDGKLLDMFNDGSMCGLCIIVKCEESTTSTELLDALNTPDIRWLVNMGIIENNQNLAGSAVEMGLDNKEEPGKGFDGEWLRKTRTRVSMLENTKIESGDILIFKDSSEHEIKRFSFQGETMYMTIDKFNEFLGDQITKLEDKEPEYINDVVEEIMCRYHLLKYFLIIVAVILLTIIALYCTNKVIINMIILFIVLATLFNLAFWHLCRQRGVPYTIGLNFLKEAIIIVYQYADLILSEQLDCTVKHLAAFFRLSSK